MKSIAIVFLSFFLVVGCSSLNGNGTSKEVHSKSFSSKAEGEKKLSALVEKGKDVELVMKVSAPDSWLSTIMMAGMLRSGVNSSDVDGLIEILKRGRVNTVAVVGSSDDIIRATILSALDQMKGKGSRTLIYYAGPQSGIDELDEKAKEAHVPFEGVIYQ